MKSLFTALIFTLIFLQADAQVMRIGGWLHDGSKTVYQNKMVFASNTGTGGQLSYYNDTAIHSVTSLSNFYYNRLVECNGKLYYSSWYNNGNSLNGYQLVSWDGTNAPTVVTNFNISVSYSINSIVTLNNKLYFLVNSFVAQTLELWMHDAVTGTTQKIALMASGQPLISPSYLTVYDKKIFFISNDGSRRIMLYYYDPDLNQAVAAPNFEAISNGRISNLIVCYDQLYYLAGIFPYAELYKYNSKDGSMRITGINTTGAGSFFHSGDFETTENYLIGFNGNVYFNARMDESLYKYDPNVPASSSNPSQVYTTNLLPAFSGFSDFIVFNDKIYFRLADTANGNELWAYDGINDPWLVADINTEQYSPGSLYGSSSPGSFCIYKGSLYFSAFNRAVNNMGNELYKLGWRTGIENVNLVDELNVYPVPANDALNFEIVLKDNTEFAVALTDISGKQVFNSGMQNHTKGKATVQADIAQLAPGNYIYRITTNHGVTLASGKVIKE